MRWPLKLESSGATLLRVAILAMIYVLAFAGRFYSVIRFESVIHEFDPWFNYRTTRYLVEHNVYDFLNWFDERSWYPLGRIVGGTVYPGLMATAGAVYTFLRSFNLTIHIREVCVFLAPWMASNTTLAAFLLAREVKDAGAGLLAAAFIAVVPGYISRSVAGSYDNEGVAIFAMVFTYFLWIRAVRTGSLLWAAGTALGYFYMVAAWGGYVFISNIIPLHVAVLLVCGRYSPRLYAAYSSFYVLSTILSMQVFFVGFRVLRTADHLAMHGTFLLLQAWALFGWLSAFVPDRRHRRRLLSVALMSAAGLVTAVLLCLVYLDYIQPFTGRFWTMFDPTYASKYIPIIASVSEHQPTTYSSYLFDLHILIVLLPVGLYHLFCHLSDGSIFLILYATFACYFSGVMVRLMLVLSPAVCVLGAVAVSSLLDSYVRSSSAPTRPLGESASLVAPLYALPVPPPADPAYAAAQAKKLAKEAGDSAGATAASPSSVNSRGGAKQSSTSSIAMPAEIEELVAELPARARVRSRWSAPLETRLAVVLGVTATLIFYVFHCQYVTSAAYSSPSIVIESGQGGVLDDYREAYYWLRRNTPEDARVMSWWDYGYQIAGMANRTTLVDNNTWNNSHIAQVGKAFASSEERALPILRQLDVDYVLVVFGGLIGYSGDDINKFLWMVRIAGSTDPRIQERDYFTSRGEYRIDDAAPKTMTNCLMYKLSYYRFDEVDMTGQGRPGFDRVRQAVVGRKNIRLKYLEEVYTTEHWLLRIYRVKKPFVRGPEGYRMLTPLAPPAAESRSARMKKHSPKKRGKFNPPAASATSKAGGDQSPRQSLLQWRAEGQSIAQTPDQAMAYAAHTRHLLASRRDAPKGAGAAGPSRWKKRFDAIQAKKQVVKAAPQKKKSSKKQSRK